MTEPGDRRPTGIAPESPVSADRVAQPWSAGRAIAAAAAVALGTAVAWALLRGILELGLGLLAVAAAGGWAIGASLRRAALSPWLAAALGSLAWLLGLVLTWLVSMAILPGSTRTLLERVSGTPFLEWLAPQLGWLEGVGLALLAGAAAYAARRPARAAS
jgi:hypothetical protein